MAVIPFPNLQPQGPDPRMVWGQRTLTARHMSPLNGVATTLERPGSMWTASLPYANLLAERRAQLINFAASCRGYASRFYMPLYGWTRRGSFSAPELFSNNYFTSTTGWTTSATTLTVADGIARLTVPTPALQSISQSLTMVQYAPYALRSILHDGRASSTLTVGRFINTGQAVVSDYATTRGLGTLVSVNLNAGGGTNYPVVISGTSGYKAGDFVECSYASLARCALVDNGPNLLLQSDEFDATWTVTRATIDDQATAAPDGTTTADYLAEDGSAANDHYVTQSTITVAASANDFSFGCYVKPVNRSWVRLQISHATGSASGDFNVTAGTVGSTSVGTDWANARVTISAAGNGWYWCTLVARKTSSATSLNALVVIGEANLDTVFNGLSQNSLALWRATLAQSSVPTRPVATTTTSTSGTAQTGSALHLKGLPASTNGLLLQGDPVEIITGTSSQLVRTRKSLDSDAAGLGYFEFEAPLRISPSDNAGVIVCNPLCRMMLDSPDVSWSEHQQAMSDFEFAAVEDTYP